MRLDAEVVIIGAGVIGLSLGRKMAAKGHSVILLEKEKRFGLGISSRNTEVIHAGIYYTTPLKAKLCVEGKELLYDYCLKNDIKHNRIGKIILAGTTEEINRLSCVKKRAETNGVDDLRELDRADIKKLEPCLRGEAALLSPSSGVFDTHGFMKSLFVQGEAAGMIFAPLSPFLGAKFSSGGWKVKVGGSEPSQVFCKVVVNAAGLNSTDISKKVFPERCIPNLCPKKGSYARYLGKAPIEHIVYPALVPGVITERVDATPDLGGSLRFGPTVEVPKDLEDFSVAPDILKRITPSIQNYIPGIDISRIQPDCAGIRPRIFGENGAVEDFRFEWAGENGWLDLWGMESPGFTASLAIAGYVYDMIDEKDVL